MKENFFRLADMKKICASIVRVNVCGGGCRMYGMENIRYLARTNNIFGIDVECRLICDAIFGQRLIVIL